MSFRCSRKGFFFLILGAASFQSTKAGTQRFTSNPSLRLHRCAQHLGVKREHWVNQGASLEQVLWKLHSNITQIQSWPNRGKVRLSLRRATSGQAATAERSHPDVLLPSKIPLANQVLLQCSHPMRAGQRMGRPPLRVYPKSAVNHHAVGVVLGPQDD